MNGKQRRYFAHAQYDLNLHILRMFEGTFSLFAVQVVKVLCWCKCINNRNIQHISVQMIIGYISTMMHLGTYRLSIFGERDVLQNMSTLCSELSIL